MATVGRSPPAMNTRSRLDVRSEATGRNPEEDAREESQDRNMGESSNVIDLSKEREVEESCREEKQQMLDQIHILTEELMELRATMRRRRDSDDSRSVGRDPPTEKPDGKTMEERQHIAGREPQDSQAWQLVPMQARLPRGGWIKNPFDELSYHGKTDKQNPIRFLEKFEKLARYEGVNEEEQAFYFGRCMKGAASQWHELQIAEDIHEIKNLFKQHFWGCQAQMRFRQQVYFGRYKPGGLSLSEYALSMARQAKTLAPPMTDEEIVQTIREHFDTDVARELRPSVVKNVSEMISMLDTIENERETRRLRVEARRQSDKMASSSDYKSGYKMDANDWKVNR